jgi:hypothetical protein
MDIQSDLKWIIDSLKEVKDPSLIDAIKNMLQLRNNKTSERINVEKYNKEIDASLIQIQKDEIVTHEEVGERIKQWGNK